MHELVNAPLDGAPLTYGYALYDESQRLKQPDAEPRWLKSSKTRADLPVDLFVGIPSVWRDDVESRVAAHEDPFVRYVWTHFARFNDLLRPELLKQPRTKWAAFTAFVMQTAWADFGNPQTIAQREAFPLEWFQFAIVKARALRAFARGVNTQQRRLDIQRRRDD